MKLWISLLLVSCNAFAAPAEETALEPTAYWEPLPPHTLSARLGFQSPMLSMSLSPNKSNSETRVEYAPKVPLRLAADFAYGPFVFFLSTGTGIDDEDREMYGTSRSTDWQFRFFGQQSTYDFVHQVYSGYYIENSEQIDPSIGEKDPRIKRPDIDVSRTMLQYHHTFQPDRFSMGGAFEQNVRQIRSGGSWLGVAAIEQLRISADSSLVPASLQAAYGEFGGFAGGDFLSLKVGAGYGYNYVFGENWNAAGVLTILSGPQRQNYEQATENVSGAVRLPLSANAKIGLTYNGKVFHWGVVAHLDGTTIDLGGGNSASTSSGVSSFFFGTRFDQAVPVLDRLSDWMFN